MLHQSLGLLKELLRQIWIVFDVSCYVRVGL